MQNVDQLHAYDMLSELNLRSHNITKSTHMYNTGTVSEAYALHRLVQHTLQIVWRWHGQMKAIFFGMRYW